MAYELASGVISESIIFIEKHLIGKPRLDCNLHSSCSVSIRLGTCCRINRKSVSMVYTPYMGSHHFYSVIKCSVLTIRIAQTGGIKACTIQFIQTDITA